jgi:large subunit ribosomal protein L14e
MYEVGRVCIKLAGRDSGRECVIVDILDDRFVLIDGNVRRRKCNILHIEPTKMTIEIKKGASHEDIATEFKKNNMGVWQTKAKPKTEKPVKLRGKDKVSVEVAKTDKKPKKAAKKVVKEAEIVDEKKAEKKEAKPAKKEAKKEEAVKKPAAKKKASKKE